MSDSINSIVAHDREIQKHDDAEDEEEVRSCIVLNLLVSHEVGEHYHEVDQNHEDCLVRLIEQVVLPPVERCHLPNEDDVDGLNYKERLNLRTFTHVAKD
jgi:hypothetical protein